MKKWYNLLLFLINIVFYFVLIALWISIPDEWILDLSLSVFNLSLTVILMYLNRSKLSVYYQSQQFKKLTETLIFLFLIFCLLGVVNYWAFKHPLQSDLSAYKMNSLTDQSKNVLQKMKGEIKFKLFARKQEANLWLPLFEFYRAQNSKIEIEKVLIHDNNGLTNATLGGTSTAGAIVIKGNGTGLTATNGVVITAPMLNATTVDNTRALASHNLADLTIDTDAGTGTNGAFLNVAAAVSGLDIYIGEIGVSGSNTAGSTVRRGNDTNNYNAILSGLTIKTGVMNANIQLGAAPQGAMIVLNTTMQGGLEIKDLGIVDSSTKTGAADGTAGNRAAGHPLARQAHCLSGLTAPRAGRLRHAVRSRTSPLCIDQRHRRGLGGPQLEPQVDGCGRALQTPPG